MHALLKSTGLYRLDGTTAVEVELERYAFYFDQLESMITQLSKDAFVETMGATGFDAWQRLLALPQDISWDSLQEIASCRLAISNRDFTPDGVKRCMAAGGFSVELTENFTDDTVTVRILDDQEAFGSQAEKEAFLQSCLPCHVKGVFVWS